MIVYVYTTSKPCEKASFFNLLLEMHSLMLTVTWRMMT